VAQRVGWMSEQAVSNGNRIVRRIAGGDRQALTELYVHYRSTLFHYLLQLTPDHGLAEEILQDTLVAPIGVGVLLADRLPRDSQSRVDELLNTLPGTLSIRSIEQQSHQ
jgi:hypothetical protein